MTETHSPRRLRLKRSYVLNSALVLLLLVLPLVSAASTTDAAWGAPALWVGLGGLVLGHLLLVAARVVPKDPPQAPSPRGEGGKPPHPPWPPSPQQGRGGERAREG